MTPEYAAPEQLTGAPATAAADIYALGVLLYVLLTGFHPAGAGPHTPSTLVKAILDLEPARPSEIVSPTGAAAVDTIQTAARRATTPERLKRMLRGDLDTIVGKALKKDPRERYASVGALAGDLRRYLSHEPIVARPDTIAYRTAKFIRRQRRSVTATLLATLALIGAMVTAWRLSRGPESPPQFKQARLTANPPDVPVLNATISPDGKYLGYADRQGIHLQLVETGGTLSVPPFPGIEPLKADWVFGGWFPDSAGFIASVGHSRKARKLVVGFGPGREASEDCRCRRRGGDMENFAGRLSHRVWKAAKRARRARDLVDGLAWRVASQDPDSRKPDPVWRDRLVAGGKEDCLQPSVAGWQPVGTELRPQWSKPNDDSPGQRFGLDGLDRPGTLHLFAKYAKRLGQDRRFVGTQRRRRTWSSSRETAPADGLVGIFHASPERYRRRKTLGLSRSAHHASALIGDLTGNGNRLLDPRRLTIDDNINIALAWTPDSREVIFSSQRAATRQIYRQALNPGSTPQPITSTPGTNFYMARLSPDGAWVILEGEPSRLEQDDALSSSDFRWSSALAVSR